MNFKLDADILEYCDSIRQFAATEIAPSAEERDRESRWVPAIWKKMAEMGLLGLPYPGEFGGQDGDCMTMTLATEAFAEGAQDGGLTLAWGAHTVIGSMPIVLCGTEEQKKRYLPDLASGKKIAGLALTEPGSGSDAAGSMMTRAEKKGDRYVLNGSKMFITNGPIGDTFIVMAVTDKRRGPAGISVFIVEKGFKGFSSGKKLDKLGMRTSTTSELILEDVEVPEENRIARENSGFLRVGKATLEWERTVLVASALGSLKTLLKNAISYARQREQFGTPILQFQAIQDKIARGRMHLDAARLLLYRSAWLKDQNKPAPVESSLAKIYATEALIEMSYELGQIYGGYGFIKEYPVERAYRDARLGTIGAGTSEVMRSILAANLKEYWNGF